MLVKKQFLIKKTLIFSTILLMSGCADINSVGNVGDDIEQTVSIPAQWINKFSDQAELNKQQWWRNFKNEKLNSLLDEAMANNQNLYAAAINWHKALIQVDSAKIEQTPTFSSSANASASRRFSANNNSSSFGLGISASYQLDLWNKLDIEEQRAKWSANAQAEDLLAAKLSLQSEVVNSYLKLVYLHEKLRLNAAQIQYQEKTYSMVQARKLAGKSSELDRLNAHQSLSALRNSRTSLISEEKQAQTALTILLGKAPEKFSDNAKITDFAIPEISTTIPAHLLRQRPDLRASQYRLQNDLADIAIKERDFYPDISLSASISTGGSLLREILQNPSASIANNLVLPFLQYREKNIALKVSKLQYEADLANFRQSLYKALADVENALISLNEIKQSAKLIDARLKDAQQLVKLTEIRYQAGKSSLNDLLDSQQSLRNIQSEVLDNKYQQLLRSVALYTALGGNIVELSDEIINPSDK